MDTENTNAKGEPMNKILKEYEAIHKAKKQQHKRQKLRRAIRKDRAGLLRAVIQ